MPLMINTNVQSLNSQRQLLKAGNEQSEAMERLSSGKRINSAADDAAGLAISNRMTSQIRGLDRAVANANDGVSMIQTAEGALDETTNILQRMNELAIQSANGIYTDSDRGTLDAEVQQLVAELDRISETTSFNGRNLLDGSLGDVSLQVGSESNQTISFTMGAMDSDTLGLGSTSSDVTGDTLGDLSGLSDFANATALSIDDGDVLINGTSIGAFNGATDSLDDLISQINTNTEGVTASAVNAIQAGTQGTGALASGETLTLRVYGTDTVAADGTASSYTDYSITGTNNMDEMVAAINSKTSGAVTASLDDNGRLNLSNSTGATIALGLSNGDAVDDSATLNMAGVLGISTSDMSDQGGFAGDTVDGAFGDNTGGAFGPGGDSAMVFAGQLTLTDDTGDGISISAGATGLTSDLAALGFSEQGSGMVTGSELGSGAQGTALAQGDVVINGVDVGTTLSADGMQGKVDAINAVSDDTGVTASAQATVSFAYDAALASNVVEITGSAAYVAPNTGFQSLTAHEGYTAEGGDFSTSAVSFDVENMAGDTTTVTLDQNYSSGSDVVAAINSQMNETITAASASSSNAGAIGALGATAGFTFDITDQTGLTTTIDLNSTGGFADTDALVTELQAQLETAYDARNDIGQVNTGGSVDYSVATGSTYDFSAAGESDSFTLVDTKGDTYVVTLDNNVSDAQDLLDDINEELSGQVFSGQPVGSFDFSGNNSVSFEIEDAAGVSAAIVLSADVTDLQGLVDELNADIGGAIGVTARISADGTTFELLDTTGGNGVLKVKGDAVAETQAAGATATYLDIFGVDMTADGTELSAQQLSSNVTATIAADGSLQFTDTTPQADRTQDITITKLAGDSSITDAATNDMFGGTNFENTAGTGLTAPATANDAAVQVSHTAGVLTFSDSSGNTGALTIDNFVAGATMATDLANDLLGIDIQAANSTFAGTQSVEAFLDQNNAVGFRDVVGGGGDILVDNAQTGGISDTSTPGDLNNAVGFDIEDLAGSTGAFTGATEAFKVNDVTIDLSTAQADGDITAIEIATAVNAQVVNTGGVTAYVDDSGALHFGSDTEFTLGDDDGTSNFVSNLDPGAALDAGNKSHTAGMEAGSIKINGTEVSLTDLTDLDTTATEINAQQAFTGVTASVDDNGELQLQSNAAIALEVGQTNGFVTGRVMGVDFIDDAAPASSDGLLDSQTTDVSLKLTSVNPDSPVSLELTANGAAATGLTDMNDDLSATVTGSAISNISVATQAGAQDAIDSIKQAITTVSETRSELGAVTNRLDFTVSNLMSISENTAAARSRIVDADFAAESANLSRAQVLQQAAQAMLAQANSAPQQVLSLLR